MTQQIKNFLKENTQDAIIFFATTRLDAAKDPHSRQAATREVANTLSLIKGDVTIDNYLDQICRSIKWLKKAQLKKELNESKVQKDSAEHGKENDFLDKLPDRHKNSIYKYGFYWIVDGKETGYYFRTSPGGDGENNFRAVTNFVMEPLFHKLDQEDNTRIVRINNGVNEPEVIELPSKALISVESFRTFLFERGSYLFDGTKLHLDKLNKYYLFQFPKAFELKTLGWQKEGFFAFFNKAFNGEVIDYNEAGLVEHDGQNFFSPASSDIYKSFRQDDDDDAYENDKYLRYCETKLDFSSWTKLMDVAYQDHAKAAVTWVLTCLYKDIVFRVDNNAPFFYSYGPSQSGKSKLHESISSLWFKQMPAFNLNSGTDFAFFQRMSRFRNCPVVLNEFNDDVVKDEWFEAIKGTYDGEGRERGSGMGKRKTETQKVNGSLTLAGQYLSTKDDNSVLSRSILRGFKKESNRPEKQTLAYETLKEHEKKGISSIITDLLVHRKDVEDNYHEAFNISLKNLAQDIRSTGELFNERVLRNYTALWTMYQLFSKHFELPWEETAYYEWCRNQIVEISDMISETDILVDFWNSLEAMFEAGLLRHGSHFKIEEEQRVKIHYKGKEVQWKEYQKPRRMLYLRLSMVRDEYAQWKRKTGVNAMALTSLASYLKDRDYYVGYCDGTKFHKYEKAEGGEQRRTNFSTSAHIFDYELLNINLMRHDDEITDNSVNGRNERQKDLIQAEKRELFD